MSLTESQVSEIVRGRLNLPTSAKLRIQKNIPNGLEIFSTKVIMDESTRHILLTPKTVTATPTNGILDMNALAISNQILVDKLHLGRIYNQPARVFTSANVNLTNNVIALSNNRLASGTKVNFATTDVLPSPLLINTDYYVTSADALGANIQVFEDEDLETRVTLTSFGVGTQTILTPDIREEEPLSMLSNPGFTSFSIAWMDTADDKFWWLVGNSLYTFAGDGSAINTELQFNVPHTASLAEFGTVGALDTLQDQFIDVMTELTATSMAKRDNDA